ncbi:MAG: Protein-tyrosine phosphatase, low molecular weight [Bryobacterales bacterium]|nr:Protein-tyrosine phosphatase, low molecular weight [Bryobacterales bacterium]
MALKPKVLFLCTQNSGCTQMTEGLLRDIAGEEFEIASAGAEAGRLDPDAVAAMQEVGIDISSATTKAVDPHLGERFHYVITMCDREQERSCPVFPGAIWRLTWPVENPAALSRVGLDHRAAVRHARDSIRHVREFIEKHHHPKSEKGESAWM